MTAISTFAPSPKAPSIPANAWTAKISLAAKQEGETTGANFSLASDLWHTPPSNAELAHTIFLVAGLVAMLFAAFGLASAVFGVA